MVACPRSGGASPRLLLPPRAASSRARGPAIPASLVPLTTDYCNLPHAHHHRRRIRLPRPRSRRHPPRRRPPHPDPQQAARRRPLGRPRPAAIHSLDPRRHRQWPLDLPCLRRRPHRQSRRRVDRRRPVDRRPKGTPAGQPRAAHPIARALIAASQQPPAALVSASAIGYYGDRSGNTLTEDSGPGRTSSPRSAWNGSARRSRAERQDARRAAQDRHRARPARGRAGEDGPAVPVVRRRALRIGPAVHVVDTARRLGVAREMGH